MSETPGVPTFSGGDQSEDEQVTAAPGPAPIVGGKAEASTSLQSQPAAPVSMACQPGDPYSFHTDSSIRPTSAKERVALLAADARLGAQVMRVRSGIDAKMQVVRDQQPISTLLSRLGLGGSGVTPAAVDGEGDPDLSEPPGLRAQIDQFTETRAHLDVLLPALEDYQRHRRGLADAEQRIGIALQEAGMRGCLPNSPSAQAISACGVAHRSAALRRLEAVEIEERQVLEALRMHDKQAVADCKRAVREYEAARLELKTMKDARARNHTLKEGIGADFGDPLVSPTIGAVAEQTEQKVKLRLSNASEAAAGKLSMLQVKHEVDYAAAVTSHLKSASAEEREVADCLGKLDNEIRTILEASTRAHLQS